ncbi:MAG: hypothetical protein ACRCYU_08165 [Nocardioides sp.]
MSTTAAPVAWVVTKAAPDGSAATWLNTQGIAALIVLGAGFIGAVVGLGMLAKSSKKKVPEQASHGLNVLIASLVIAGSLGGIFYGVAQSGLSTFFTGN